MGSWDHTFNTFDIRGPEVDFSPSEMVISSKPDEIIPINVNYTYDDILKLVLEDSGYSRENCQILFNQFRQELITTIKESDRRASTKTLGKPQIAKLKGAFVFFFGTKIILKGNNSKKETIKVLIDKISNLGS